MNVSGSQGATPAWERIPSDLALRTRLRGELNVINDALGATQGPDELRDTLLEWTLLFREALNDNSNNQDNLNRFKTILREILTDPFTNVLLTSSALLGSDGYTYHPVTIDAYRRLVSAELRDRSPRNPNDATPFTTRVHPHVLRMLRWIESHDDPASVQDRRRARLRDIIAEEDYVNAAISNQADQALIDRMLSYANERLEGLRVEAVRSRENLQSEVDVERQREQEARAIITNRIEAVEQQYRILEEETEQIGRRLNNTTEGVNEVDRARLRIAAIVKQLEMIPKARKSKFWKDLLKVGLIVGAAFFATWAINAAISAAAGGTVAGAAGTTTGATASSTAASRFSAYVAPTRGGGIGIQTFTKF